MRVVLNIPDEVAEQVIETFARAHGWQSEQQNGPIGQYAGQQLIETIMGVLRSEHGEQAAAAARQQAVAEVNQYVQITLGDS